MEFSTADAFERRSADTYDGSDREDNEID